MSLKFNVMKLFTGQHVMMVINCLYRQGESVMSASELNYTFI